MPKGIEGSHERHWSEYGIYDLWDEGNTHIVEETSTWYVFRATCGMSIQF